MPTIDILRRNVRALLAARGQTPYAASRAAGRPGGWLGDILSETRYQTRIGSDIIDEVGLAVGVEAHELLDPGWEAPHHEACSAAQQIVEDDADEDGVEEPSGSGVARSARALYPQEWFDLAAPPISQHDWRRQVVEEVRRMRRAWYE